jgi:hypothetical protein
MDQRELTTRLREYPEVTLGRGADGREVKIRRFTPIRKGRSGSYAVVDRLDDEIVADDLPSFQAALEASQLMLIKLLQPSAAAHLTA